MKATNGLSSCVKSYDTDTNVNLVTQSALNIKQSHLFISFEQVFHLFLC